MKQGKQIYYKKYFENNLNNITNTWKRIKGIFSIKNVTTAALQSIGPLEILKL